MAWKAEESWFDLSRKQKIFLFCQESVEELKLKNPPVQLPEEGFPEVKRLGREAKHPSI
jgi:hypothetical protein